MSVDLSARQLPSNLLYGLDDKPGTAASTLAAVQHLLASLVGIVTPTLIIGGVLGSPWSISLPVLFRCPMMPATGSVSRPTGLIPRGA